MDAQKLQTYAQIVSKAWTDPAFKQEFISNPNKVLRDAGFDIDDNVQLSVIDNCESWGIPLPSPPEDIAANTDPGQIAANYCSSSVFCC
jgi:hypothetical protein